VRVINTSSNTVSDSIKIGTTHYEGITISPDGSKLYVTNTYDFPYSISVVNIATNKLSATIRVGSRPIAISVSPDGMKVYVTNNVDNTVSVINTLTNTVSATINVGNNPAAFGNFISKYSKMTSGLIPPNTESPNISIYPNPTSSEFTICSSFNNYKVIITDLMNHAVLNQYVTGKNSRLNLERNGIFFVHIKTSKGTYTQKLIVNQ
jgi:YVTN family beta-propeller protein